MDSKSKPTLIKKIVCITDDDALENLRKRWKRKKVRKRRKQLESRKERRRESGKIERRKVLSLRKKVREEVGFALDSGRTSTSDKISMS